MQNPDISFIQLKLTNIGTALFYCGPNSQLPFSTYIITALKIDEGGGIWFFISKGLHEQINDKRPSEAQLEFYRKGYPFFMKINGQASVADTKEKMQDLIGKGISLQEETLSRILLINVKIEKVIYKELRLQKSFQPLNNLSVWLKNIIHPVQTSWQPSATI
jgi:hypothetical protein